MIRRFQVAGPRTSRGPVRRAVLTVAAAAACAVPPPAHAVGPLSAKCLMDRNSLQVMTLVAYAYVSPGDVATRIDVRCTATGGQTGYTMSTEATSAGVAAAAASVAPLVVPDSDFMVCWSADARLRGGETVTFDEVCEPH